MGKIVIFSTLGCIFCTRAKAALNKHEISYYEVNLSEFPSLWDQMQTLTHGKKSVPQIFFNSRYIGVSSSPPPSSSLSYPLIYSYYYFYLIFNYFLIIIFIFLHFLIFKLFLLLSNYLLLLSLLL